MPANINNYTCEVSCEYKGRVYRVRDNGAVYRIPKEGYQPSLWEKEEDKWTFGRPDVSGYLFIGSAEVHSTYSGPWSASNSSLK